MIGEGLEVAMRSCSAEEIKLVWSKLVKQRTGVRARTGLFAVILHNIINHRLNLSALISL